MLHDNARRVNTGKSQELEPGLRACCFRWSRVRGWVVEKGGALRGHTADTSELLAMSASGRRAQYTWMGDESDTELLIDGITPREVLCHHYPDEALSRAEHGKDRNRFSLTTSAVAIRNVWLSLAASETSAAAYLPYYLVHSGSA